MRNFHLGKSPPIIVLTTEYHANRNGGQGICYIRRKLEVFILCYTRKSSNRFCLKKPNDFSYCYFIVERKPLKNFLLVISLFYFGGVSTVVRNRKRNVYSFIDFSYEKSRWIINVKLPSVWNLFRFYVVFQKRLYSM